MLEQPRWSVAALLPPVAGLVWLWSGMSLGVLGLLVTLVPGGLLVAAGFSTQLYPGDVRIPQFLALGGATGVGLSILLAWWLGPLLAPCLFALSCGSFLAAGRIAVRQEPPLDEVPEVISSWLLDGEVAFDEVVLGSLTLRTPPIGDAEHVRILDEVERARALYDERGWLSAPETFHRRPDAPTMFELPRAIAGGLAYEHLQFDSEYEPWPDEPGRDRWSSRTANRRAHAWILRHGAPRPWLICVHGYEMGVPRMEFGAFRARRLHDELGVNLAFPTLPLHGLRRTGRRNGGGYLGADFLDSVHAQAQALWDLRRLVAWIRSQSDEPIGVYGLSLGGYNAALLASLEPLAAVIAGVPAVDFHRLTERHGAPLQIRAAEVRGLVHDHIRELFRVVSPLAMQPRVAHDRRAIFAGLADRIVPPDHPRDLWVHWDRPRIVWYPGGHVSFRRHPNVDRLIDDTLRVGELIPDLAV